MSGLKAIGASWLVVAALSIAMTLAFRVDPTQIRLTLGLAVVTAVLGIWMILRPSTAAVGASLAVAIVWLAGYASLAALQSDDVGAWVTDAFLAVAGLGVGLVVWTRRTETSAGGKADRDPAALR